jgi:hypothetical protein
MEPMKQEKYIHVDKDGNKCHYKVCSMKIRHRLDGPAIEYADGSRTWWVDGKRHRIDGPAIEYADGGKEWWVNGKHLTEEQFNAFTAPTLELTLEDIAAKFGVDVSKLKIVK